MPTRASKNAVLETSSLGRHVFAAVWIGAISVGVTIVT
jgi:hypothetical protein